MAVSSFPGMRGIFVGRGPLGFTRLNKKEFGSLLKPPLKRAREKKVYIIINIMVALKKWMLYTSYAPYNAFEWYTIEHPATHLYFLGKGKCIYVQ